MAAKSQRRIYRRRPDLGAASAALGCDYSHLRRVVIGERKTPLLARYRAWKRQQRAAKLQALFPPSAAAEVARAATHLANPPQS